MSHRTVLLFLATMACDVDAPTPPDATATTGGQSGTAAPERCVEIERVEVLDLEIPSEGFSFSAADLLDGLEGAWRTEDGARDLILDIQRQGPVYSVRPEYTAPVGTTTSGAPSAPCDPFYVLEVSVVLDGGDWLTFSGGTEVTATDPDQSTFSLLTPYEETTGTLAPDFDATGFPVIHVGTSFAADGDTAHLGLSWHARSEATPQGGTTSGPMTTATATAVGLYVPIGDYDLVFTP